MGKDASSQDECLQLMFHSGIFCLNLFDKNILFRLFILIKDGEYGFVATAFYKPYKKRYEKINSFLTFETNIEYLNLHYNLHNKAHKKTIKCLYYYK